MADTPDDEEKTAAADETEERDSAAVTGKPAPPAPPKKKRGKMLMILFGILVIPAVVIALWVWIALGYTYSSGKRAGYVQKISKKGWICKTWEGELAMANLPGTMPQIFSFSVRSDSIAQVIEQNAGKQVSLDYEEHPGIPTSCFGETQYFVVGVQRQSP